MLEALRRADGGRCSGEILSAAQGVSRAQVWKHIESLRRRGYEIDASPGAGYRLLRSPDRLYPEEILAGLETRWLAREIHYFESVDSTNRVALDLARAGAAHGTSVIAEAQTAGRGRLGRSFFSPPHQNLYTSILLRPSLTTDRAPAWILATASAVAEAVAEAVGDPDGSAVEIKWPNDVLLGGRKTSGILLELGAEATRVSFLVLGIGVNLNVDPAHFPAEFRSLATSLAHHRGEPIDRAHFTRRLYGWLERTLDLCAAGGFEAVRPRFERRFRMAGRAVRVRDAQGAELAGVARGIDEDGALLVETRSGEVARVIAGDVSLAKEGGV